MSLPAVFDGSTDYTCAIQQAEDCLAESGGGILQLPPGKAIVSGLTKRSNTIWQGAGKGVTTLLLKPGTTTSAVVAGDCAYSLFGSNSLSGIVNWGIRDLTIDGNRTGGCTSDGLGTYGWIFDIDNVEIKSCNGTGWRNEYGQPGIEAHQNTQSHASKMLVWDNQVDGIYFCGPTDSTFYGLNVYWNLRNGIWLALRGTVKATDCHVWSDGLGGRQHIVGWRLDSAINTLTGCVSEGSSSIQTWIRSSENTLMSGETFYNQASPNTTFGIVLGDMAGQGGSAVSVMDNTIITRVDNCQGGAVVFNGDLGHNRIDVLGRNNGGGKGYSGAMGPGSRTRIDIAGAASNATLNFDPLALGVVGLQITGVGSGPLIAGPANGGGAGYRLLAAPN
jgi:hypothetical protein